MTDPEAAVLLQEAAVLVLENALNRDPHNKEGWAGPSYSTLYNAKRGAARWLVALGLV